MPYVVRGTGSSHAFARTAVRDEREAVLQKRNNLVPQVRTVLKAPVEVGKDSELGRCLMINVTEARQRVIMKKAKKGAPAEETKAPETEAPAPAKENT